MKAFALFSFVLSFAFSAALRAEDAAAYQIKVPDMSCAGCAMTVTQALKKLDHVTQVYVDPKAKVAIVAVDNAEGPGESAVTSAVKAAGYEAKSYDKLAKSFDEAKAALTGKG